MRQSCPCTFLNPLEGGILPDPVESPQCALNPGLPRYRLNDPSHVTVLEKEKGFQGTKLKGKLVAVQGGS
jgi:hypothetical protein